MIPAMRRGFLIAVIVWATTSFAAVASKQRAVRPISHPPAGPTFSNEVVRIFQDHCQSCHHPGDIGPFSLMDYQSAKPYAPLIRAKTLARQMPPWKPTAGCGDFANVRTVSSDEIDTISRWVLNGAPEGDRSQLPPPLDFSAGWTLGQPDLVLSSPEPYTPPVGADTYRCLTLPSNLTTDQYVSAIDVHPGDRKTVHHVIAFIDKNGDSQRLDDAEPGPGYTCFGGPGFAITDPGAATLGGWAPGTVATRLPEQVAFRLPAGARVVLQVHYHAPQDSEPQGDNTELGIYFAKKKPQQQLYVLPVMNDQFTIPPNDPNYKVVAPPNGAFTTPVGVHLWGIYPHMHLLGRKMNVKADLPDGTTECLINIDDWDFNWQGLYQYTSPVAIPAGSRLSATAYYDNSTANISNPNHPPKPVSWGEKTTDEMCIAFIAFTVDGLTASDSRSGSANMSWVPQFPLAPLK